MSSQGGVLLDVRDDKHSLLLPCRAEPLDLSKTANLPLILALSKDTSNACCCQGWIRFRLGMGDWHLEMGSTQGSHLQREDPACLARWKRGSPRGVFEIITDVACVLITYRQKLEVVDFLSMPLGTAQFVVTVYKSGVMRNGSAMEGIAESRDRTLVPHFEPASFW